MGCVNNEIDYHGIDVSVERIRYARALLGDDDNLLHLYLFPTRNSRYNKNGTKQPQDATLGPDKHYDAAIAVSVMTHIGGKKNARHYLQEFRRVLKPGGKLFCTWYTSPPVDEPNYNAHRTTFLKDDVFSMLEEADFECVELSGEGVGKPETQLLTICE